MRLWHLLITRLRSLFLRRNAERELDEELHLHLERELDRKLAEGVPVEQARRELRAEFGCLEQIKEECRDARGIGFFEEAIQDIRYGARSLCRSPGFVVTVVLTLALGIGTSTAIFSVVYGVLWKPLPIKASDRVAALWLVPPAGSRAPATPEPAYAQRRRTGWQGSFENGRNSPELAPADFADIREQTRMFEQVAAANPYSFTLTGAGEPIRLRGWQVSREFLSIAGIAPQLGRTFLPEDHVPGANRTVLLSYRAWQTYFGGDSKIVGANVRLDGVPSTVVGVMPEGFDLPVGGYYSAVEMWAPLPDNAPGLRGRESTYWPVMARLAPRASWQQAQQELDGIGARLAEQYPQSNAARRFRVMPIREHLVGTLRPAILVLAGAVGLVLLTACANVACLLLMRRSQRRRELAVRLALGASRGRVARQLMMEHGMLAAAGTVLGVAFSYGLIPALLALNPATSPLFAEVAVDGAALAFSLALCVVTAILFGLVPALRFASSESWRGLELGSVSVGENRPAQRMRGALVVSQVALSVALLAGAGLLARTFANLLSVDPGLRTEGILSAQTSLFGLVRSDPESAALVRDINAKMAALPGVMSAAGGSNLPMTDTPVDYRTAFSIEGQPATPGGAVRRRLATIVTEGYFRTMGIALEEGRVFDDRDRDDRDGAPGERVIVINRTMARLWRGASPVGAKVRLTGFPVNVSGGGTVATVVGVVRDVVHTRPDADAEPEAYMPHAQVPVRLMTFVLRTNTDPATLAAPVRSILREAMPGMPLGQITTMEHFRSESFRPERFNALLLSAFAGSTLLLAAIGLYGVVAYAVTLRLREFALRFALGARQSDIIQGVLQQGLKLAASGVALGLGLALVGTRLLSSMLFDVDSSDLGTYAAITGVTLVAACLACLLPARRASSVNPASALRSE